MITGRPNPLKVTLVDENFRYVIPAEVPRYHETPELFQNIREFTAPGLPVDLGVNAGFSKLLVGRGMASIVLDRVYHVIEVRESLVSGFTLGSESARLVAGGPPSLFVLLEDDCGLQALTPLIATSLSGCITVWSAQTGSISLVAPRGNDIHLVRCRFRSSDHGNDKSQRLGRRDVPRRPR